MRLQLGKMIFQVGILNKGREPENISKINISQNPRQFQAGVVNQTRYSRNFQAGVCNESVYSSSLQIGTSNEAINSRVLQIGPLNMTYDSKGRQAGFLDEAEGNFEGVQLGIVCYAERGSYKQFGLVTIRGESPWYKRFSPLFGFRRSS